MSDPNYTPPVSNVATAASGAPLATPLARLAAVIIDIAVLVPLCWLLGMIIGGIFAPSVPTAAELIAASAKSPEAVADLMPGRGTIILWQLVSNVLSTAVFIGVNYVFLQRGQTIGKMVLKLQVLDRTNGGLVPIKELILRRVLPFWLGGTILSAIHPALGLVMLADALCIFRKPLYNTLHDDLANTKVVQQPGNPIAALNPGVPAV